MQSLVERAFVEPFYRLGAQLKLVGPVVMTVLVILILGAVAARVARHVVYLLLVALRFDRMVAQTGMASTIVRTRMFRSPADFGARLVEGILWLMIVLLALSATDTRFTQDMLTRFVNYVPDLVTAALVLLLGSVVSKFLARSALLAAVNSQWTGARLLARGVRIFVMSLAVVVALEQLRIGRTALLVSFAILFAGIVVAAAIAFGLGARELAREWLQAKMHPRAPEDEEILRHL